MNKILCPECLEKRTDNPEEKTCAHGCGTAKCVECGRERRDEDPYWSCLGTVVDSGPSRGTE